MDKAIKRQGAFSDLLEDVDTVDHSDVDEASDIVADSANVHVVGMYEVRGDWKD